MTRRLGTRAVAVGLIAALLLFAVAPSSAAADRHFHHARTRVFIGFGPAFWWGPPYWYYPPPYYYYPPRVIVREPSVYVQQAPAEGALEPGYWYYCQSAGAYYPTAPSCPEPWVKVPPRTEP